jgi:hypothetical protein
VRKGDLKRMIVLKSERGEGEDEEAFDLLMRMI